MLINMTMHQHTCHLFFLRIIGKITVYIRRIPMSSFHLYMNEKTICDIKQNSLSELKPTQKGQSKNVL